MSRPFADVLRELSGGETYDSLSERLTEVVAAVMDTRKQGELSLKLTIKPNGEVGVRLLDEIKAKVPERTRGETIFFVAGSGDLVRNDPRQSDLPLRRVGEAD